MSCSFYLPELLCDLTGQYLCTIAVRCLYSNMDGFLSIDKAKSFLRKLESCREQRHLWAKLYILKVQEVHSILHSCQQNQNQNSAKSLKTGLDIQIFVGGQFVDLRAPNLINSHQKRIRNVLQLFLVISGAVWTGRHFLNCEFGFKWKFSFPTP